MVSLCECFVLWVSLVSLINFSSSELYCVNDEGREVDWYVVYKIPKLTTTGFKYAYISGHLLFGPVDHNRLRWKLSTKEVNDSSSHFGQTLQKLYENNAAYTYVMYNDQPPNTAESTNETVAKGVIAMDSNSGFWLTHSVPKFMNEFTLQYTFPDTAAINGQMALCISFKTEESANRILYHLQTLRPNIYSSNITPNAPNDQITLNRLMAKEPLSNSFSRNVVVTYQGLRLPIFAKSAESYYDIYSEKVAFDFESNLLVQSWRSGTGNSLPSNCSKTQKVKNIDQIMLIYQTTLNNEFIWDYTQDNSKWAVGNGGLSRHIVCIADLNRIESDTKRGGGVACFEDDYVWVSFVSLPIRVSQCPVLTGLIRKTENIVKNVMTNVNF